MKIPLTSVLKIKERKTSVCSYYESGKYGYLIRDSPEMYCSKIFSSETIYSSKENAIEAGRGLLKKIEEMEFAPQRKSISDSYLEF